MMVSRMLQVVIFFRNTRGGATIYLPRPGNSDLVTWLARIFVHRHTAPLCCNWPVSCYGYCRLGPWDWMRTTARRSTGAPWKGDRQFRVFPASMGLHRSEGSRQGCNSLAMKFRRGGKVGSDFAAMPSCR